MKWTKTGVKRPSSDFQIEIGTRGTTTRKQVVVEFGSVKVRGPAPEKSEIERNIKAGQIALARARQAFLKPGVRLNIPKHVPRFQADPNNPSRLIRDLDGRREFGHLVEGKFEPAE